MSDYDDGSGYKPNFGPSPQGNPAANQDPFSVGSLITGIFAIVLGVFCGLLAVPLGIVAIFMGLKGRQRSREMGKGTAIATAGLVMGFLAIIFTVVFVAVAMITGTGTS